jgi:prepilin-type N-terminal cleavage/methylation domain-containing protein
MKNNQSSAFTLVELLTVIAVVALLAGLTATLLPRAKMAAHRAASAGNLRQLGQAVTAFSAAFANRNAPPNPPSPTPSDTSAHSSPRRAPASPAAGDERAEAEHFAR